MAVKWAVANGNWSAGATWNDGVVPTANDDVYLSGFCITNLPNTISVKSLHNDANADYSVGAGGHVEWASSGSAKGIIGDVFCESTIIQMQPSNTSGSQFTINGNIHSSSVDSVVYFNGGVNRTHNLNINGNISFSANCKLFKSDYGTYRVTIVGNIESESTSYLYNGSTNNNALVLFNFVGNIKNIAYSSVTAAITTCTGSGSWQLSESQTITAANITGDIIANEYLLTGTTLNINGSITYKSTNNTIGVRYTTLNILNPDTFTWKDVTEPRSNPFIILTDAEMNNRQQYPSENEVKEGTEYVWGEKIGTYQQPPESVVLKGYVYDNGDKVGSLENQNIVGCVTKEDVREGVELIGLQEVGTLVVPSVDDVREGVIFDNGSVGTLIVEGGGDRLRIANFGYYTDSQSDTYIVDLTEQDKPKFAVAEERVLIEMFPELDFDNIPDKYFDDLFVKYLKYRLIVEYYRTAGINSTFSTSEPTTEIVNYRNVNCEIWMNIANTYLKAWGEKYPNSIKKQRILL